MSRRVKSIEQQFILAATAADLLKQNEILARRPPQEQGLSWRDRKQKYAKYVLPGKVLTQYGTTYFRAEPRYDPPLGEVSLSMVLGVLTVEELAPLVTGRPATPVSTARYFHTDDLYLNNYVILHTGVPRNPKHVSVYFRQDLIGPGITIDQQIEKARTYWSEKGRVTLDELALTAEEAKS